MRRNIINKQLKEWKWLWENIIMSAFEGCVNYNSNLSQLRIQYGQLLKDWIHWRGHLRSCIQSKR